MMEEAVNFIRSIPKKASDKVIHNARRVAEGEMSNELFKKLEGSEIWEFRTKYNGIEYRLFAFWDTEANTLVVATHGIVKKSQRTPKKEIEKAEIIRKMYFNIKIVAYERDWRNEVLHLGRGYG